eukprot:1160423-Pelagomonas_calceolata.AAC.14
MSHMSISAHACGCCVSASASARRCDGDDHASVDGGGGGGHESGCGGREHGGHGSGGGCDREHGGHGNGGREEPSAFQVQIASHPSGPTQWHFLRGQGAACISQAEGARAHEEVQQRCLIHMLLSQTVRYASNMLKLYPFQMPLLCVSRLSRRDLQFPLLHTTLNLERFLWH